MTSRLIMPYLQALREMDALFKDLIRLLFARCVRVTKAACTRCRLSRASPLSELCAQTFVNPLRLSGNYMNHLL
jgi:hypothetical protein